MNNTVSRYVNYVSSNWCLHDNMNLRVQFLVASVTGRVCLDERHSNLKCSGGVGDGEKR